MNDQEIAKLMEDTITIDEAVALYKPAGPSERAIRNAIRDKKVRAWYPGGDPHRLGRGVKMRVYKSDLQQWWFGAAPR